MGYIVVFANSLSAPAVLRVLIGALVWMSLCLGLNKFIGV